MITTGQNTLNTENMWTVESQRVREESIHPSANHTRANVHIEEYSGPGNMVAELGCVRKQDTVVFDQTDVPKGYTSLRLVKETYRVDINTWEPPNTQRLSS